MLAEGTRPELHVGAFDMTYAWNTYDILLPILEGKENASAIDEALRRERYQFPRGALRLRFTTNHDKNAYDAQAKKLARMFEKNFEQFTELVPAEVRAAGPRAD